LAQQRADRIPDRIIILDHQNVLVAALRRRIGRIQRHAFRLGAARQEQADRGADAGHAIDIDMPAALGDKAVGHRQPEAGAGALGLGREERFERALPHFRRDAGAAVLHRQHHVVAGGEIGPGTQAAGGQRQVVQRDVDAADAVHRVAGIDCQVQNHVLQLVAVDQGMPKRFGRMDGQRA
jgi:hypothetical protein